MKLVISCRWEFGYRIDRASYGALWVEHHMRMDYIPREPQRRELCLAQVREGILQDLAEELGGEQAGDRVRVLLGNRWVRATVLRWFEWGDGGGNVCVSYELDIGTGRICAGRNSIRPAGPDGRGES
ncbi:MAG: hypothetical protein L0Z62_36495 [Gemmataceae bacterium]|nr:hypothetical protein [Gemmataceae bacterium]